MGSTNQQRDPYLRAQIQSGETVLAVGPQAVITDRRLLFGWRLIWPPHTGEWTHDALAFDEITRWHEGRRHDDRPLLWLEHPSHRRLEWIPAHRLLWFRWGNATGEISHGETTFSFANRRDPVFRAMKERLELAGAPRGDPFAETLPGTRAERLGGGDQILSYAADGRFRVLTGLRRRLRNLDEHIHHARIKWWIRVASWSMLAVPAWFISPWLAVPAVVLVEVAWVVGLQWSWHRDRHRRVARPLRDGEE
jgi:hypothetical protein